VLGLFGGGLGLDGAQFLALLIVAFAAYLGVIWGAPSLPSRALWWGVALAIALFALAPPLLSLDFFSYISYGRLELEGLNPYAAAPVDLPADDAAQRVQDYRDAESVYGPLFTWLSVPLAALGVPAALWALKALTALAALALVALVGRVAAWRGADPRRAVAAVALNPIFLVHGVGGAHNDVLMALGVVAGIALVWSARESLAGAALTAAVAVKSAGGIAAPFALLGAGAAESRGRRAAIARLLAGALAAAALVGAAGLALYGADLARAFDVLGSSQGRISHWSVPATISRAGLDVDVVRAVLAAGFAIALILLLRWTWRGGDWVRAAGWATFALLIASAYMTPWYVIWLLPFAALARDRTLLALTLALTAFQLRPTIPL
jgi:hypothetical protein